jgi:hypothetical protein
VFIDDFELTALSLGGTVGLPSPPPATGAIDVLAPADPSDPIYLRITQRLSLKLIVRRIVRLSDVALIQAPVGTFAPTAGAKAPGPENIDDDYEYGTPELISAAVQSVVKAAGATGLIPWICDAVAYLPCQARVLMQVEMGVTAEESAEYYPPLLIGEGSQKGEKPTCRSGLAHGFDKEWYCHH